MTPATEDDAQEPAAIGARRGWSLKRRLVEPDAYGALLILVLLSIIVSAFAGDPITSALVIAFQAAVLTFAMWTSRAPRRLVIVFGIGSGAAVIAGVMSNFTGHTTGDVMSGIASMTLSLAAIVAVVRRLVSHPVVDGATVLGALCVYLLLGLFFASVYGVAAAIGPGPLFAQEGLGDGSSVDRIYFSYVTITTVGYGDITVSADVSRMLAISEALLGQIYLVTVVALLVSNMGRQRRGRST